MGCRYMTEVGKKSLKTWILVLSGKKKSRKRRLKTKPWLTGDTFSEFRKQLAEKYRMWRKCKKNEPTGRKPM